MPRCPQKQGPPGTPVGTPASAGPGWLSSRVCSCFVAPPQGPCVRGVPRTSWGTCLPCQPSHPTPSPSSTRTVTSKPVTAGQEGLLLLVLVPCRRAWARGPPWHRHGPALVRGWVALWWGDLGRGNQRGQQSTRQWVAWGDGPTKNVTFARCRLPPSLGSECWVIVTLSFMGRKYKVLVLNVVSEIWSQTPAYCVATVGPGPATKVVGGGDCLLSFAGCVCARACVHMCVRACMCWRVCR